MKYIGIFFLLFFSTNIFCQDGSFPLEINAGYIEFNDDANFNNTWYVGGSSGFNFTENAGIRGYYWRAMDNGDFTEDLDNLEIYGLESIVKIPITTSVKPYLVAGGGLLKPFGVYIGEDGEVYNQDKFFGSAGAGLDLSFINFLSVTGYVRSMIMSFSQLDNFDENNTNIEASWNYGGTINFRIGDRKNGKFISRANVPIPSAKDTIKLEEKDNQVENYDRNKRIDELEQGIENLEEKLDREEEMKQLRKEIHEEIMKDYNLESNNSMNSSTDILAEIDEVEQRIDDYEASIKMESEEIQNVVAELKERETEIDDSLQNEIREIRSNQLKEKANTAEQIENLRNERAALANTPENDRLRDLLDDNIEMLERRQQLADERFEDYIEDLEDEAARNENRYRNTLDDIDDDISDLNREIAYAEIRYDRLGNPNIVYFDRNRREISPQESSQSLPQPVPQVSNPPSPVQTITPPLPPSAVRGAVDTDNDGVVDEVDNCPNVVGAISNYGCPTNVNSQNPNSAESTRVIERIVEVEPRLNFLAQSIFFELNSAQIKGSSEVILGEIYALLNQFPNLPFVIEGHTDSTGTAEYNRQLSQKRAQAVVNALVAKGIQKNNLIAIGLGESQPFAANTSAEGREKNRRVHIRVKK